MTGEVHQVRENGATSGIGLLAAYAYDDLGRQTSLTRGNGTVTTYGFDAGEPAHELKQLQQAFPDSSKNLTLGFGYNAASQIIENTRSNHLYSWTAHSNGTTSTPANGLNQLSAVDGTGTAHDAKGNMTADGLGRTFGYSSQNLLTSASGGIALSYDPMLRLYQIAGGSGGTTRFAYDGVDLIAEHNGSNAMLRRYVHGPDIDEPLVRYEGSGTSDRRWLHADERGSIVAVTDGTGAVTNVNTYDPYGKPGSGNVGRFQYTGQKWIAEIGLYDYKARMYHPGLPRFMQPDPIGYDDGMNLYAYVGGDPVNFTDPLGLKSDPDRDGCLGTRGIDYDVCGRRIKPQAHFPSVPGGGSGAGASGSLGGGGAKPRARPPAARPEPKKPSPQEDECAYRNSSGDCTTRRDKHGKLYEDESYLKKACESYKALMTSNRQVALGNVGLSAPGTANAATGGQVRLLGKISGLLSSAGSTFMRGVTAITTGALAWGGAYSKPKGCQG